MPPPFERPRIRRKKCLSWEAGLIAKILKTTPPKTVTEEGILFLSQIFFTFFFFIQSCLENV